MPIHIWGDPVIRVHKANILSLSMRYTGISSRSKTSVLLMNHLNILMLSSICLGDLAASIRRTVVNADNLNALKSLGKYAIEALGQIAFHVIHGNNHAHQWLIQKNTFIRNYLRSPSKSMARYVLWPAISVGYSCFHVSLNS